MKFRIEFRTTSKIISANQVSSIVYKILLGLFTCISAEYQKSLAIYRDLALADVAEEYESAMQMFPVR